MRDLGPVLLAIVAGAIIAFGLYLSSPAYEVYTGVESCTEDEAWFEGECVHRDVFVDQNLQSGNGETLQRVAEAIIRNDWCDELYVEASACAIGAP